ncbi:MAG: hypothetical protein M1819_005387 [Sarea resinae]|nr:MAG: hypothetical protein M1819_005387 [Sarea resinae]
MDYLLPAPKVFNLTFPDGTAPSKVLQKEYPAWLVKFFYISSDHFLRASGLNINLITPISSESQVHTDNSSNLFYYQINMRFTSFSVLAALLGASWIVAAAPSDQRAAGNMKRNQFGSCNLKGGNGNGVCVANPDGKYDPIVNCLPDSPCPGDGALCEIIEAGNLEDVAHCQIYQ